MLFAIDKRFNLLGPKGSTFRWLLRVYTPPQLCLSPHLIFEESVNIFRFGLT